MLFVIDYRKKRERRGEGGKEAESCCCSLRRVCDEVRSHFQLPPPRALTGCLPLLGSPLLGARCSCCSARLYRHVHHTPARLQPLPPPAIADPHSIPVRFQPPHFSARQKFTSTLLPAPVLASPDGAENSARFMIKVRDRLISSAALPS